MKSPSCFWQRHSIKKKSVVVARYVSSDTGHQSTNTRQHILARKQQEFNLMYGKVATYNVCVYKYSETALRQPPKIAHIFFCFYVDEKKYTECW